MAFSPGFNLAIYYGGSAGYRYHIDRIIIAPPFIIKKKQVDHIVEVVSKVVHIVCNEINSNSSDKYGGGGSPFQLSRRYSDSLTTKIIMCGFYWQV